MIVSGCILHNVCLDGNDLLEEIVDIAEERRQILLENPQNLRDIARQVEEQEARIKRTNIMNGLSLLRRQIR